ncbi:MAG: ADOP family duplicated permease [Gemmatimonas sp.]
MNAREMLGRIRAWRMRAELDRQLASELEEHLELLTQDFENSGMSPADARIAARKQLGNVTGLSEQSRDAWGFPRLTELVRDVRYAIRGLRRSPGFTIAAIVTMGLGIGANTTMLGVIDRLMFRPFPLLRDPSSVHRVYTQTTVQGRTSTSMTFPYTRFLDLRDNTHSFEEYAAVSEWRLGVGGDGQDVQVRKVAGVSASFFRFFDATPVRGRYFTAQEDSIPTGTPVALLSYRLWANDFGSRDVVGAPLKVGRTTYTIIGVAPDGFIGTVAGKEPDVFVPISTIPANLGESIGTYATTYSWDWTEMLVRRKPGVSQEQASADLTNAFKVSRSNARALNPRVLPDSLAHPRAVTGEVRTAGGPGKGPESRVLLWVSGVAAIVLLIACASVANLMLSRVIRRRREITVRVALGVSRTRLVGQFLCEGAVLALAGAFVGVMVAQWGGAAIRAVVLPQGSAFNMLQDWQTMAVALACATVCTLFTALAPALVAMRSDIATMLKSGTRNSHGRTGLQTSLLVVQVSLSAVLLIGAALFVRSFEHARNLPLGYDAHPVLEVVMDFRGLDADSVRGPIMRRRMFEDAQRIAGVRSASQTSSGPFRTTTQTIGVPGIDSVERLGRFNRQVISPDYFATMQTRIVRGRAFTDGDRSGALATVIVSEAMGRVLWPGKDAIGQCVQIPRNQQPLSTTPCSTVVGIAGNTTQQSFVDDQQLTFYVPVDQFAPAQLSTILLRMTNANVSEEMERVRRELTALMPGDGFVFVRPLQEVVDDRSRSWRLGATLFLTLGGLAFIVAAVGLYGVMNYDITGRAQEIGVRMALGAQQADVSRMVIQQGASLAAFGVVIGIAIALVASRWIQPLLFKQSASDPMVIASVGALMMFVALGASALPAYRASKGDPGAALRAE